MGRASEGELRLVLFVGRCGDGGQESSGGSAEVWSECGADARREENRLAACAARRTVPRNREAESMSHYRISAHWAVSGRRSTARLQVRLPEGCFCSDRQKSRFRWRSTLPEASSRQLSIQTIPTTTSAIPPISKTFGSIPRESARLDSSSLRSIDPTSVESAVLGKDAT